MAVERTARVVDIVEHSEDTRSIFLAPDDPGPFEFRPGQFISCLLPHRDQILVRPYSIASVPSAARLEILLNLVPGGLGSHHLFSLRPGDPLRFTGPWGTFILGELPAAETVFVAEHTAIAPIRPLLLDAARRAPKPPLHLLYGTTLGIYRAELAALPGLTVDVVSPHDVFDAAIRRYVDADQDRSRHFFICGIGAPVLALRDRLRAAGYGRRAVQYERW